MIEPRPRVGIGGDAAAGGGAVQGQRVAVQRGQGQRRPQLLGGEGGTEGGASGRGRPMNYE